MQEQIVNFETAKLAKERGFTESCWQWYDTIGNIKEHKFSTTSNRYDDELAAPTQSLLQKWLREIHGIHIDFQYDLESDMKTINVSFSVINNEGSLYNEKKEYLKYEEALEEGLQQALELIH